MRTVTSTTIALIASIFLTACSMFMNPPAASEFGLGPRASHGGLYVATIDTLQALKVGKLQRVKLTVRDASQHVVEDATITIDGGMPQHGHGLPTAPKVSAKLGNGTYQVDGLKFNMGGWWELKFRIVSAAGTDSVTFNIDL